MLKIIRVTGPAAAGKTHALYMMAETMKAEGRPVLYVYGENSSAKGIAQAAQRIQRQIPRKGWRRLLPGFLCKPQFNNDPVTILLDEATERLIQQLERTIKFEAYLVATVLK